MERRDVWSRPTTTAIVVNCRHCLHHQALEASRAETWNRSNEPTAWYRCRNCENRFRIRWADAVALGVAPTLAAAG